ncbi:MAG TPA: RES family NAD+ phosphorylase [Longimicrobium sp.]|jgi:hypothetical protein
MAVIMLPRRPPMVVAPPRTLLWRIHRSRLAPLWFGPAANAPPSNRFDAPAGEFGICYFGASLDVAFLETLVRGATVVAHADLADRSASCFATREEMRFLHFEGAGLVRLGVGADVAHGAEYGPCQQLACDLFQRHPEADGVQFRSRWDTSQLCWAIFERAAAKLGRASTREWLGDYGASGPVLERHDLAVV